MGVYIQLKAFGEHIPEKEWTNIYEEALTLLKAENAIGIRRDVIQFDENSEAERIYFSTNIEKDTDDPARHHWDVVGDIDNLLIAESFSMHRNNQSLPYREPDAHVDIIADIIREIEDDGQTYDLIFDGKTQGYPYHYCILAVGMLLEDRFPRYAVVSGNIDRYQAIKSQEMIKQILNKTVQLPVVTEWERLIDRIKQFKQGVSAINAFSDIIRDDPRRDGKERLQAIKNKFSETEFNQWILTNLKHYESASQNGSLNIFIDSLNAGFDIKNLAKLACIEPDGPLFKPDEFFKALVESLWITVPMDNKDNFSIFQKPKGDVDGVMSQFGLAMFDMMGGMKGRDLKIYIPEDQLLEEMETVFPDKIKELRDIVKNAKKKLDKTLQKANENLNMFQQKHDTSMPLTDGTEFFTLDEGDPLNESIEMMLKGIAYYIYSAKDQVKDNDELNQIFNEDNDLIHYRFVLTKMTGELGPTLTENAWNWIDKEKDVKLLRTLLILAAFQNNEQTFYNTKKSIFEKRWLCKLVTDWSMDDEKMTSMQKMMDDIKDKM